MSEALSWLRWETFDLAIGSWEARHSLFVHYTLYGAVLACLVIVASPLGERGRTWVLVAASAGSLALLGSLELACVAFAYAAVLYLVVERVPGRTGTVLGWGLVAALAAYPALLPATALAGNAADMREFWAFASNVWWLRCVAYLVDRRYRAVPPRPIREYLVATLFFPTFVNGPIETTEQLAAHRRKGPAVDNWEELRAYAARLPAIALRFGGGVLKVILATFYLGQSNETIFATGGTSVGHLRLWLWAAELYASFYVIFSGWTDVAIALGRLVGYEVQENFEAPWRARSVADFWRRWHISFGVWLRNYVYIPLGGNRHHSTRNVMATFLASGLWHVWGALKVLGLEAYPPSAWSGFVIWGVMNGGAVVAARWWSGAPELEPARTFVRERLSAMVRDRANQAMAFGFVSVAWIPFFLPPWVGVSSCWRILQRMLHLA